MNRFVTNEMHQAMNGISRELALTLYRVATGLERSRMTSEFARQQNYPACILFYHRVSNRWMNDWSISNRNFRQHLLWLSKNSMPSSLDEVFQTQSIGRRNKPMVAITFDDGYSENARFAIPQLLELQIPATYFVSTHFVQSGDPFPHDMAAGRPLKPNTISEIKEFANQGIQIGAHSHTHVDFGQSLSQQQLRTEITDVRKRLQDWTGQSIDYFAFPYGLSKNFSQEAVDVVFESGFKCFMSAAGGYNWPGQHIGHLQRIHGDPGAAAMKNWLTIDPRKLHCPSPFQSNRKPSKPLSDRPCLVDAIA